jgi:hypothetical protein
MREPHRILAASAIAIVTVAAGSAAALAGDNDSGFETSAPSMLSGRSGTTVTPILTVGETLGGGYRF